MKTIREWLETLEEPYRSQALDNWDGTDYKIYSLSAAIAAAFFWPKAKEGLKYWQDFYLKVASKERSLKDIVLKKSNHELAEMIWKELSVPGNDGEGYTLTIESILDQYR